MSSLFLQRGRCLACPGLSTAFKQPLEELLKKLNDEAWCAHAVLPCSMWRTATKKCTQSALVIKTDAPNICIASVQEAQLLCALFLQDKLPGPQVRTAQGP